MLIKANIDKEAKAFLNALFQFIVAQNRRATAAGDPDATQIHFTMMTLHAKLAAVPRRQVSWQDYSDNILNTAEAFGLHRKSGGYCDAPIIGSVVREIRSSLNTHAPQKTNQSGLASHFARTRNG